MLGNLRKVRFCSSKAYKLKKGQPCETSAPLNIRSKFMRKVLQKFCEVRGFRGVLEA